MVNAVTEQRLLDLAKSSWRFNRPVWETKAAQAEVVPLFPKTDLPEERTLRRAARKSALRRPNQEETVERASTRNADKDRTRLTDQETDQEVFSRIFGTYASGDNHAEMFKGLREFFTQNDLGNFAERTEFLHFLKLTLDKHKYSSASVFAGDRLHRWFTECDEGKTEGTKL